MADNVVITAGVGTIVHADEYVHGTLGSGKTQLVKLVDGTLDSDTAIAVDEGGVANALRVCPADDLTAATYIGDVVVTDVIPGVAATNLGKAEDAGHTTGDVGVMMLGVRNDSETELAGTDLDYCPIAVDSHGHVMVTGSEIGQSAADYAHGLSPMAGVVLDALPATDIIAGNGEWGVFQMTQYGEMRVKDESANTLLGTIDSDTGDMLTALQIMDDWDESDRAKVNPIVGQAGVQGAEGGVTALTQRVTIATDDDSVAHLATIAGDTTAMDTNIANISLTAYVDDADWVDGTSKHMLVGGLYQIAPQTITNGDVGPLQVDVNGKIIESSSSDIKDAVEIMDDWDATHDSAASADGPQLMASYDSTKPTAVDADADAVRVLADAYGRLLAGVEPQAFQAVFDSANASAEGNAVHASAASTIIVVQSYVISSDTELWVKLQDEASAALTGKFWLKAGGGVAITLPDKAPIVLGVDSDLEVITEGAGNISVSVTGYTIPG